MSFFQRPPLRALAAVWLLVLFMPFRALSQDPAEDPDVSTVPAPRWSDILEDVQPAVVRVIVENAGRAEGSGTGFFVRSNGWVATNLHVIADGETAKVQLEDGREFEARFLAADDRNDLALLKVVRRDREARSVFPELPIGSSDSVRLGDPVMLVGHPRGRLKQVVSRGDITSLTEEEGQPVFLTDADISPGSSGSPLMNLDGEVIGVIFATDTRGQALNFAIPSRFLADLITRTPSDATPKPLPRVNPSGRLHHGNRWVNLIISVFVLAAFAGTVVFLIRYNNPAFD